MKAIFFIKIQIQNNLDIKVCVKMTPPDANYIHYYDMKNNYFLLKFNNL